VEGLSSTRNANQKKRGNREVRGEKNSDRLLLNRSHSTWSHRPLGCKKELKGTHKSKKTKPRIQGAAIQNYLLGFRASMAELAIKY